MAIGRPSYILTPELAASIMERLADGESLRSICRDPNMPSRPTVYGWVLENKDSFADQYARAREMQAHALSDDIIAISDDGSNDWMERHDPNNRGWEANGEHMQRSRLRVDARKWAASKILPKVYGEKTTHDVNVSTPASRVDDAALLAVAFGSGGPGSAPKGDQE